MIGWLFTPGRRWWQLLDLALGIADDLQRGRRRARGRSD
jgi:hypothetical protein